MKENNQVKKLLTILLTAMLLFGMVMPVTAMAESWNGYEIGDTLKTTKKYYLVRNGRGTKRVYYTATKDVLVSVTRKNNQKVEDVSSKWAEVDKYAITEYRSCTITVSASAEAKLSKELAVKLGMDTSVTQGLDVGFDIAANKAKSSKLAVRADYYIVTYKHYTYDKYGKQTGVKTITMNVPIEDTAEYYVRYK